MPPPADHIRQEIEAVDEQARRDIDALSRMGSAAEDAVDRLRHELPDMIATALREQMTASIRDAILLAAHDVGKDAVLVDSFWKAGSDRLFKYGEERATKWVGARLLTAIGTALIAGGMYLWLKANGRP